MKTKTQFALFTIAVSGTLLSNSIKAQVPGSMDLSFRPVFEETNNFVVVWNMLQTADSKILAGGLFDRVNGQPINSLARLNQDGSVDTNFNIGTGFFRTNDNLTAIVGPFAIQTDGKILVGSDMDTFNGSPALEMIRLNPDGSRDADFNVGSGPEPNDFFPVAHANRMLPLNNGQILVVGDFTGWDGHPSQVLARLNTNGSVDTTFQTFVTPVVDEPMNGDLVRNPDGSRIFLMTYNIATLNGVDANGLLVLDEYGNIDTNYNRGTGPNAPIQWLSFQSDGKTLVAGDFTEYDGVPCNLVARFYPDGTMDTNFVTPPFFGPPNIASDGATVWGIQQMPDGKILISGAFSLIDNVPRNSLARLNADGSLDLTFDPGTGLQSFNAELGFAARLTDQLGGQMLTCGIFDTYDGATQRCLVRFQAASGPLLINSIARSPAGTVTVGITKPTDTPVILQGTENFTLWTNLATNSQPAGTHNLVDPSAAMLPRRYYRLRSD